MNRFTLLTTKEVDEAITEIWLASKDRKQVTAAVNKAEGELANRPLAAARNMGEGLLSRDFPPLRFYYTVWDVDEIVTVTAVATLRNDATQQ